MADNQSQIMTILMDIKSELGNQRGLIEGMHQKQDYTNGRVTKNADDIDKLKESHTEVKTKVALFGGIAGVVGSVVVAFIKRELGI